MFWEIFFRAVLQQMKRSVESNDDHPRAIRRENNRPTHDFRAPYDYFRGDTPCEDFRLPRVVQVGDILVTKDSLMAMVLGYHASDDSFIVAQSALHRAGAEILSFTVTKVPVADIRQRCTVDDMPRSEVQKCIEVAFMFYQMRYVPGTVPSMAIRFLRQRLVEGQRVVRWELGGPTSSGMFIDVVSP